MTRRAGAVLTCVTCVFAAQTAHIEIAAVRTGNRPLFQTTASWASKGAFNPAAARIGDKTVLLFLAINSHDTSRIGYAESTASGAFRVDPEPVLVPETEYEKGGGVED